MKYKYLAYLMIMAVLLSGCLSESESLSSTDTVAFSSGSSYLARSIPSYTEEVPAIVIGTVTKVSDPYVELTISEVLKGDTSMRTVNVLVRNQEIVQIDGTEKTIIPGNEPPLFIEGEHVLVFLGMNGQGEYVSYAGPYGKYLINLENNTTSIGEFSMSLSELKQKIQEALENSSADI